MSDTEKNSVNRKKQWGVHDPHENASSLHEPHVHSLSTWGYFADAESHNPFVQPEVSRGVSRSMPEPVHSVVVDRRRRSSTVVSGSFQPDDDTSFFDPFFSIEDLNLLRDTLHVSTDLARLLCKQGLYTVKYLLEADSALVEELLFQHFANEEVAIKEVDRIFAVAKHWQNNCLGDIGDHKVRIGYGLSSEESIQTTHEAASRVSPNQQSGLKFQAGCVKQTVSLQGDQDNDTVSQDNISEVTETSSWPLDDFYPENVIKYESDGASSEVQDQVQDEGDLFLPFEIDSDDDFDQDSLHQTPGL